jgi:hypothetical protein
MGSDVDSNAPVELPEIELTADGKIEGGSVVSFAGNSSHNGPEPTITDPPAAEGREPVEAEAESGTHEEHAEGSGAGSGDGATVGDVVDSSGDNAEEPAKTDGETGEEEGKKTEEQAAGDEGQHILNDDAVSVVGGVSVHEEASSPAEDTHDLASEGKEGDEKEETNENAIQAGELYISCMPFLSRDRVDLCTLRSQLPSDSHTPLFLTFLIAVSIISSVLYFARLHSFDSLLSLVIRFPQPHLRPHNIQSRSSIWIPSLRLD